jgi:hypothetical protein
MLVVLAGLFLMLAGILTFGFGALAGILGGALTIGASTAAGQEGAGLVGAFGGLVAGLAFVVVFWGLLEIVASIGMFIHRGWGRALGLIVGVVGLLFTGLGLLGALGGNANAGGVAIAAVFVAGYALTVVALVTGGAHFRRA